MKKTVLLNITKLLFILFTFFTVTITAEGKSLIFYESFDELQSVIDNGGHHGSNGWMKFIPGFRGNAADFTGSKNVSYPMINDVNSINNLDLSQGTLEFWVKSPNANHLGMFDIGSLGSPNSWGIFKNKDHIIMEVKNSSNRYDQAWSPGPISADGDWHLITAVWEVNSPSTYFKICVDGQCKNTFDGLNNNSYPNQNGDFCVGWSGWYGSSESAFDELSIFDYVMSDEEIIDRYQGQTDRPVIELIGKRSYTINIG
ncbi:MAG: hypothetical protein KAR20_05550, partial [Candidatus Heimdallarchaeota archaeon]|nr:hypothetical protein [Candidatus Heimdallarchaeota archaeon]